MGEGRGDSFKIILVSLSCKGVYSKRKDFANSFLLEKTLESKFFPFRVVPFSEGDCYAGKKLEVTKPVSLTPSSGNGTRCIMYPLTLKAPITTIVVCFVICL